MEVLFIYLPVVSLFHLPQAYLVKTL